MAPKKPTPFEQPPRADSSEEVSNEEDEDEEEVSEGSQEEVPKKTDPKPDSSSEDSGSDEEVTPVAPVKPVEVQSPKVGAKSKQKQPDAAPAPASTVTLAKLGKKRPVESKADWKDSKKLKKVADVEDKRVAEEEEDVKKVGEDPKKQLFQRLFSEDDEIEMLKALLYYSAKKCIDPIEDFNDFHDFVKKSIHVDVSSAQLADKIRRMRKKYEKNVSKTKEGVDKTLGKPHEQLCYDISKRIWGKAGYASGGSELKANGKGKRTPKPNMTPDQKEKHASSLQIPQVAKKEKPVRENSSSLFCLSELAKTKDVVGMMGLSDDILKKAFELLSNEARAALEEKWKNMATAELELYDKRLELSREHVKLSLDVLKPSGHRG
ncbi:unnamed protein product [Rhodiola kirilowii]